MKYLTAKVMLAVSDEVFTVWSEHADWTFELANAFHAPDKGMYLLDHDYTLIEPKEAEKLKYSVITEEGGI